MPTICPKCRTIRPANAAVPDWQCPACGVAYAKAGGDGQASSAVQRAQAAQARQTSRDSGDGLLAAIPWGKLVAAFLICYGGWVGYQHASGQRDGGDSNQVSRSGNISGGWSEKNLRQVATKSQANDVVFYTAPWCPHCRAAHQWLDQ